MKYRVAFLSIALAALGLWLPPGRAWADFPPYTKIAGIAVVAPLSGPEQRYGLDLSAGVQAAVDDANIARGITDLGWEVHTFDDQADPGVAQQQAQFALVDSSTAVVIGHIGGQETLLALPVYHDQEVPLIVPTSPIAQLTRAGFDDVFRLCPTDVVEGQQAARYADRTLHAKKAAVIYEENDYGADTGEGFMNYAAAGKTIAAKEFGVDVDLKRLASVVSDVKTYDPDILFVSGTGADMARVVNALRTAGVSARLLGSQAFFNDDAVKRLGSAADGLIVSSCVPPIDLMPAAQAAVRRYQATHGRLSSFSLFGYVAAQVAMQAARQAHSTDRRTLDRQLSIGTFSTIIGPVSFQKNGDPIESNIYFYAYKSGGFKYEASAYPNAEIVR